MTMPNSVMSTLQQRRSTVAEAVPVACLRDGQRQELLGLMSDHFENIDKPQFFADLDEKHSVILISDPRVERIVGFATLGILSTSLDGEPLAAIFAGDTVVEPAYWGHHAWIRHWSRQAFELAESVAPDPAYFLLLTSTHRSYRFLPGFFRDYWPRPDHTLSPLMRRRRDALVRQKFAREYDAASGVISLRRPTPVREHRVDPVADTRDDTEANYFRKLNPGYQRGDFLVCFTEYSWANMTALGRRISRQQKC